MEARGGDRVNVSYSILAAGSNCGRWVKWLEKNGGLSSYGGSIGRLLQARARSSEDCRAGGLSEGGGGLFAMTTEVR